MSANSVNSKRSEMKTEGKKKKIVKSKFSPLEDMKLRLLVLNSPNLNWAQIASCFERRSARQCRERWQNYLDPSLINAEWTKEDDEKILEGYKELGPHWNAIAKSFYGRSGNSIRNRYLVLKRQEKRKELEMLYSHSHPVESPPPPVDGEESNLQTQYFSPAVCNISNIKSHENNTPQSAIDRIFNDKTLDTILHDDDDFMLTESFLF